MAKVELEGTKDLGTYIQRALKRAATLRRSLQIGGVLVGVLIAGVSEAASNSLDGSAKAVAQTIWFVGLSIAFVAGCALAFFEQDTAVALELARAAAEKEGILQGEIRARETDLEGAGLHAEWLARLYSLSIAHREITEQIVYGGFPGSAAFTAQVAGVLDLLVADKAVLFGIHDERWNFAVYIFDSEENDLWCVACRRPHVSEAEGPHRRWEVGEGHVGLAFERRREFVEADLADPETAKFFAARDENIREYDASRYRSIASIPLKIGEFVGGVLVATSDIPARFRPSEPQEVPGRDPVEALRITAGTLAIMHQVAHIHMQLPGEDDGETQPKNSNAPGGGDR
jgi:hypothetical protein